MDIGKIKELSKILTKQTDKPKNNIIFGRVVSSDSNGVTVLLDGADDPIPVDSVTEVNPNDRVMIQVNDHVASILGNVSDKSITRTTADGLIDVFANNGTFSGTLSAATGSFSGTVTASELTARNATLYGDNDDVIISISDRLKVTKENTSSIVAGVDVEEVVNSVTHRARIFPNSIVFSRSSSTDAPEIQYASDGKLKLRDADVEILNNLKTFGTITANGAITGDSSITASGAIKSTGGAVIANNCTTWSEGVAGGYISTSGRLALVSGSSSNYPNIVFVKNKNTSANTTLRANNTGTTTYTLTLPNSTGTLAVASSDKRLKENIKPSEVSGLDLINKIELKQFDWLPEGKEGAPHWKIGIIADELEELDENLVFGGGDNEDGTMNVKGIDTTGMIAYLVKAVQELSAEVKALRGEQNVK